MVKLSDLQIPHFYDNLLDGYYFKEIVRTVLDMSDYMVFPYGFESAFSYIKIQLHKGEITDTPTARKIRSSPDLLVYDPHEKDIRLVEVKSRNYDDEKDVIIDKIGWYKRYWEGSILSVIIPHGHWFYAQYIDKLEIRGPYKGYNLRDEFDKFEDIFPKVNTDTLYRFKPNIAEKMGRSKDSAHYFLEKDENSFLSELLRLIRENKGKTVDQLFDILNHDNLVSMQIFTDSMERLVKDGKICKAKERFYLSKNQ